MHTSKFELMSLGSIAIQLLDRKSLALRGASNFHLVCVEGSVWLTIEGQECDFILCKGEKYRIVGNGLAVIQGLPSGAIHLVSKATLPLHQESEVTEPNPTEGLDEVVLHFSKFTKRIVRFVKHNLESKHHRVRATTICNGN